MKNYFSDIDLEFNEEDDDFAHEFHGVLKQIFHTFFNYGAKSETFDVSDFPKHVFDAINGCLLDKKLDPYTITARPPYSFAEDMFMDYLMHRIREENPDITFGE